MAEVHMLIFRTTSPSIASMRLSSILMDSTNNKTNVASLLRKDSLIS
jgi:hypothetical protein